MNSVINNAIDLWMHSNDVEDYDAQLSFRISNAPNPNAGVSVDGSRYIDIFPTAGWSGVTNIEVEVEDSGGLVDSDTFQVTVVGTGQIAIDPESLSSSQESDQLVARTLTIYNIGTGYLSWEISEHPGAVEAPALDIPWISTDPISGTIASGHSMPVIVTFDSTGMTPGVHQGSLRIASSDPDYPQVYVPLAMHIGSTSVYLPLVFLDN